MIEAEKGAESESLMLKQLFAARDELRGKLDAMTTAVSTAQTSSDQASRQLMELRSKYESIVRAGEKEKSEIDDRFTRSIDQTRGNGFAAGATVGGLAMGAFVIATGGAGAVLAAAFFGANAAVAGGLVGGDAISREDVRKLESEKSSALEAAESSLAEKTQLQNALIQSAASSHDRIQAQLKGEQQERLYFGVVSELLLDNGINIARQLNQFAHFNGVSIDDIFDKAGSERQELLGRIVRGMPKADDIRHLVSLGKELGQQESPTPETLALRQFINQALIPNRTYFELLASFADDIRQHDLNAFPPLEILGQKPVSMSGRIEHKQETQTDAAKRLERAEAKEAVRKELAEKTAYHVLRDSDELHLDKMKTLIEKNDDEINQYAKIFKEIEKEAAKLEAEIAVQSKGVASKQAAIDDAPRFNDQIEHQIRHITARDDAKRQGARAGAAARSVGAVGSLVILDMVTTGGMGTAIGALSYGAGEVVRTAVESSALQDYVATLRSERIDDKALAAEIKGLEKAIEDTKKSREFQLLKQDEAKRTRVVEAFLLRSLLRNGYNNSLAIEETCEDCAAGSIDEFLAHYKGTRLGLALKKHCHGVADSNDMSVILAEANCLRGPLSAQDQVLKAYVEEVMKPNIASFLSKASKMDVIGEAHLTGFANELHFPAEMQLENSRAVGVLLANEFGMSVIGHDDVRSMFDFWLHRHGDRRLYDEKIRDGDMADEYPEKRVSHLPESRVENFVDMAKRSVASRRASFPKIGDMFQRICAYEYFLPQAVHVGGQDNIFTQFPEAPCAYPMVNAVIGEFIKRLSFADINDYREKVGDRLDNLIAQSFMDFFAALGDKHTSNERLSSIRADVKAAGSYDDYSPLFDRYAKNITRDALQHFDLFCDIYRRNLEKQLEVMPEKDRPILEGQIEAVKHLADGKLNPSVTQPGTHEARLRAHFEAHTGENLLRRGG